MFLSVTCNDVEWPEDVSTYRRGVAEDRERYPLFAPPPPTSHRAPSGRTPPPTAGEDRRRGPAQRAAPAERRDASTPHRGGKMLREKFGDRARLVCVDDSGHGVYAWARTPAR
ncbi:hypothetical protein GCM10023238_35750 [Streptomyces heliomycini]